MSGTRAAKAVAGRGLAALAKGVKGQLFATNVLTIAMPKRDAPSDVETVARPRHSSANAQHDMENTGLWSNCSSPAKVKPAATSTAPSGDRAPAPGLTDHGRRQADHLGSWLGNKVGAIE